MEDELTLRDLYEMLARYRSLLIVLPLLVAVLTYLIASVLPRSYQSKAVMTVSVAAADASPDLYSFDPKLLPSPGALASAYQAGAPSRLVGLWKATGADVVRDFDTQQDQQSGALTLSASASTPEAARGRAELAAQDFQGYVNGVVSGVLRGSLRSSLSRAQAQISTDRELVSELKALRAQVPATLPGVGQSSLRDQLQTAGVDPRFAGASDVAANPAYTLLTVRLTEAQTRMAGNQADSLRLRAILQDSAQQLSLTQQLVQVNLLGAPFMPLRPQGIGPGTLAVLAYLLALVGSLLFALLHHAVRGPELRPRARRAVAHGD